jgi:hypothetical protein
VALCGGNLQLSDFWTGLSGLPPTHLLYKRIWKTLSCTILKKIKDQKSRDPANSMRCYWMAELQGHADE